MSLIIPFTHIHAQTQAEMNAQARAEFVNADAELNKTYEALLTKLPNAESKEKLKQSQRAWLAFRDAEAEFEGRDGTMAPTLRFETKTELTEQRTNQLKATLEEEAAPDEKDARTSSPTPTLTSSSIQGPDENPAAAVAKPTSVSPDKQWEYKCVEYDAGLECRPQIVKGGTTEVVIDLDQDLTVSGSDSPDAQVVWAPDSKRFAFNYSPPHAHHTTYETVAFYQLRDDKWVALHSPLDDTSDSSQLVQPLKKHLPKGFNPRRCAPDEDVLKVRNWPDANTTILYAPCYGRTSGELEAGFLFTLKFDATGNWKIVKTYRMSKKELEQEQ